MKLRCLFFVSICLIGTSVRADAEHDRIADERSVANAKLVEQERECARRFIVADCLENARRDHRTVLNRLRYQELQLDDARRQSGAAARRRAAAEKAEAHLGQSSDAVADAPRVRLRQVPLSVKVPEAPPESSVDPKRGVNQPRPSASDRQSREQHSHTKYEARICDAEAHRATAEKRNAARAARGKVVSPLPMPSAASAPR